MSREFSLVEGVSWNISATAMFFFAGSFLRDVDNYTLSFTPGTLPFELDGTMHM